MCGQPNPPEVETCVYCQARLKPLWEEEETGPESLDFLSASPAGGVTDDQEIPEWLRSLRTDGEKAEEEPEESPPAFEAGEFELPEWMLEGKEEEKPETSEVAPPVVPPFIEGLGEEETVSEEVWEESQPLEGLSMPESLEKGMEEEEFPKWLESLPGQEWEEWQETGEAEAKMEEDLFTGAVPPFISVDESLFEEVGEEWLKETTGLATEGQPEETKPVEEAGEELPAWLSEIQTEEKKPEKPLPPAASVEKKVETAGPLYGLRNILPAEPLVAQQKAPVNVIAQLMVTEKQQAQADLFLQLIQQEGMPKPISPSKGVKPQVLWRVLLFLVLFAAAAGGLLFNPFPSPPQELNVGVFDTMQAISQLSPRAATLVIVDYEAGDFAEMQATAYGLMDQLMVKGAYLVFVSTTSTGALQADRLVREVSRLSGHKYMELTDWVNLGYIPGGAAGIPIFALSPRSVLPYSVDGQPAWSAAEVASVQKVGDFSLVVLLSENSNRARMWIEQLQRQVDASRLLLGVSAQADPVMRAYYEATPRQMQGLVSGLNGGAIFETQAGRPGIAMQYWNAYSLTVTSGVILILMGSFINIVIAFVRPSSRPERGKKA
jgi:hypothetical protein